MKDQTQLTIHRIILMIGVGAIPIILSSAIYNVVDCNQLTQKGYQMWLTGNPGKSFAEFKDSCENIHPMILILVPASPVLVFVVWFTTRRGSFVNTSSKEESK
jgi:hypothetical protein